MVSHQLKSWQLREVAGHFNTVRDTGASPHTTANRLTQPLRRVSLYVEPTKNETGAAMAAPVIGSSTRH